MEQKTLDALKWIAQILNEHTIPYRVGGGMATHLYGSGRTVNDIDISISGSYFPIIVPLVKDYVTAGPKHYKNEKWDCDTLSLNYHGQDIDLTDVDTLLMSKKDTGEWVRNKDIYDKHPNVVKGVDGVPVSLMNPRVLLEYKQELSGEHQEYDMQFLRRLVETEVAEL